MQCGIGCGFCRRLRVLWIAVDAISCLLGRCFTVGSHFGVLRQPGIGFGAPAKRGRKHIKALALILTQFAILKQVIYIFQRARFAQPLERAKVARFIGRGRCTEAACKNFGQPRTADGARQADQAIDDHGDDLTILGQQMLCFAGCRHLRTNPCAIVANGALDARRAAKLRTNVAVAALGSFGIIDHIFNAPLPQRLCLGQQSLQALTHIHWAGWQRNRHGAMAARKLEVPCHLPIEQVALKLSGGDTHELRNGLHFKVGVLPGRQPHASQEIKEERVVTRVWREFARQCDVDILGNVKTAAQQVGAFEQAHAYANGRLITAKHALQTARIHHAHQRIAALFFTRAQLRRHARVDTLKEIRAVFVGARPAAQVGKVAFAVEQHPLAWLAIAPGATHFLIVTGKTARGVEVHNEANVGLVNAHAKGDGGHDNARLVRHKAILNRSAALHARVVGFGGHAHLAQRKSQRFSLVARVHIDNAAARRLFGELEYSLALLLLIVKAQRREMQVVPEDVQSNHVGRSAQRRRCAGCTARSVCGFVTHILGNFIAHARWRGGRHRQRGWVAQLLARLLQEEIVRTKVMPPQTHAVGLVNHKEVQPGTAQRAQKLTLAQSLRCCINQLVLPLCHASHAFGHLGIG